MLVPYVPNLTETMVVPDEEEGFHTQATDIQDFQARGWVGSQGMARAGVRIRVKASIQDFLPRARGSVRARIRIRIRIRAWERIAAGGAREE